MIIALSDIHLGYEKSNSKDFNNFIDSKLLDLGNSDHLVLLGDIVDFWRSSNIKVIQEHENILDKIYNLQNQTNVYFVRGNHDYSLMNYVKLSGDKPIFKVSDKLILSEGNVNYFFIHGHQLEALNLEPLTLKEYELICEILCDRTEDFLGSFLSNLWDSLKLNFKLESSVLEDINSITEPPENRSSVDKIIKQVQSKFFRSFFLGCKKDDFLIFGHTHKPFFDKEHNVANTGSWVNSTVEGPNTYIVIDNEKINLVKYQ
jgi:UDP-2,3-diacylglucosamine pyrophosphatase LpxH